MQLIILGMHRSGTSMLARVVNLMGGYFGPEGQSTGANEENPKGFWERRDVRQLNDAVLHGVGCDWDRVAKFDIASIPDPVKNAFRRGVSQLVLNLDGHRPWFVKEPRLCLLLPLWKQFFEAPVCIHMYRHPVEVAASLFTRNGMPIPVGLQLWERYVRASLAGSAGMPRIVVYHRQLIEQPIPAVSQLLQDLQGVGVVGLHMPSNREITSFISPDLYRQREFRDDLKDYQDAPQVALFHELVAGRLPIDDFGGAVPTYDELAKYEEGLPPLQPPIPAARVQPTPADGTVELLGHLAALRGQLALRDMDLNALRQSLERSRADLEEREGRISSLEVAQAEAQAVAARLRREGDQHAEQSGLLEHDLRRANAALTEALTAADDLKTRISLLEQMQAESQSGRDLLRSEVRSLQDRMRVSDGYLSQLEEALAEARQALSHRDERIACLENAHAEEKAERHRLQQLLRLRSEHTTAAEHKIEDLLSRLTAARDSLTQRDRRIEESARALAARHADVERLQEELAQRSSSEAELECRFTEQSRVLLELQAHRHASDALVREQAEAADAQRHLTAALQGDLAERDGLVSSLREHNARLQEETLRLRDELAVLTASVAGYQKDLAGVNTELGRLQGEVTIEHERRLASAGELGKRHEELAALTRLVFARQGELDVITARLAEVERARTAAVAAMTDVRQRLAVSESAREECATEIENLRHARTEAEATLVSTKQSLVRQKAACLVAETELQRLRGSFSWKLLAPVRAVSGALGISRRTPGTLSRDRAILERSGLFDVDWYLREYPDVDASGVDPIMHYLSKGAMELRNPSESFNTSDYLDSNPELLRSGENPLVHYAMHVALAH